MSDKIKKSKPELNVVKGAKAARLQCNKMIREQKRTAVVKEKRAFSGQTSPPHVVVLFGLSASVNLNSLEEDILVLLSRERNVANFPAVASSDYKLRATVVRCLNSYPDPMKQEPLVIENTPDLLAGEQKWPTEAEMAEADKYEEETRVKKKRLPKSTSEYQVRPGWK